MKILIIGGTRFLGRHLVTSARARGHEVTLFNRGKTNPGLFRRVKTIGGDREHDLDQLTAGWDAVIDTCGYVPRVVRLSAEALRKKIPKYVFISSISVYADFSKPGLDESGTIARLENETEEVTPKTYGVLKALCENAVEETYRLDALIIRPGLIVGPHDPTDRFTYWPVRIRKGGSVLTPDRPEALTQFIDSRDLADFILRLIEQDVAGVFNVTGNPVTLNTVFETCKRVSQSDAKFIWAPTDFLARHNVKPWSDMPAWLPDTGEDAGFAHVDISKALNAGLKFTDLSETIVDTLKWEFERPENHEWKAGLKPEREKELLELLRVR